MSSTAAHLTDSVIPHVPVRHVVLTLPFQIRHLVSHDPKLTSSILSVYARTVFEWVRDRTGQDVDPSSGCGMVTFIQRASGSLARNPHFHAILLDGLYAQSSLSDPLLFHTMNEPSTEEIEELTTRIAASIVGLLEKKGLIEEGEIVLDPADPDDLFLHCQSASIQSRIAFGPRAGQRVETEGSDPLLAYLDSGATAVRGGFGVHLGRRIDGDDRASIERLCRYAARGPLSESRLSLTSSGKVRLELLRPWANGTEAILYTGVELIEKISALIPPPRTNQIRYFGILGPNACWRDLVVPSSSTRHRRGTNSPGSEPGLGEGPGSGSMPPPDSGPRPGSGSRWIPWACLLARVFLVDVLECDRCGGRREVISYITWPPTIVQILSHLNLPTSPPEIAPSRAGAQAEFCWN